MGDNKGRYEVRGLGKGLHQVDGQSFTFPWMGNVSGQVEGFSTVLWILVIFVYQLSEDN